MMSFFTSKREQRFWAWTLAVIVAIYSTLGLTRTLAGFLRDSDLLGTAFLLGMIMVGATIVLQGLRKRPGSTEIGVAIGIAACYFMVLVRMALPEERTHLIEYSVVAVFVYEALSERASNGKHVPVPALLAILITSLVGILDECIQAFLPSRVFDLRDIVFNILASIMAVGASAALRWARHRDK